ncbi:hypothetical protein ABZ815_49835 [Nonomuraea sp. NPDC047529]|uniref:hypothetical protein n=1 Tax=Nonomuraea sp. NPDC047529 TaxID=3155623 RepID=UPI0033CB0260
MEAWAKLIEATGGLIGATAWPIAVVIAVWLIMRRHRDAFGRLIDRVTSLQLPGGVQIDLAAQEAQVQDLASQVVSPELDESEREERVRELLAAAGSLAETRIRQAVLRDRVLRSLNARQIDVLTLMARGMTQEETAADIGQPKTYVTHLLAQLRSRLQVDSDQEVLDVWRDFIAEVENRPPVNIRDYLSR